VDSETFSHCLMSSVSQIVMHVLMERPTVIVQYGFPHRQTHSDTEM